ncbi:MAG: hypothetical protein LBH51_09600 [Treponema sp.]|jgi:hypothetical protein|nr:hypothetical protein [Treponema sp.]
MRVSDVLLIVTAAGCCLSCGTLRFRDIGELARELPRHSSSRYLTRWSLPAGYFERAYAALDDPYVYIVLSDTGSPGSRVIGLFTMALYNHVSLAFDRTLETLVSYNGGNGVANPGLNAERLEFLNRKTGASLAVYRLRLEPGQKAALIEQVRAIDREGSSYNLLGLLTGKSKLPNIMFCSQFVYTVLDGAGLAYFEKEGGAVRPEDFIREQGPLEFAGRMEFSPPPGIRFPDSSSAGRAGAGNVSRVFRVYMTKKGGSRGKAVEAGKGW